MTNTTKGITKYKEILKSRGITHQELADYIGHTREHVTLWLNGKRNPTPRTLIHISSEIETLLNSTDRPKETS